MSTGQSGCGPLPALDRHHHHQLGLDQTDRLLVAPPGRPAKKNHLARCVSGGPILSVHVNPPRLAGKHFHLRRVEASNNEPVTSSKSTSGGHAVSWAARVFIYDLDNGLGLGFLVYKTVTTRSSERVGNFATGSNGFSPCKDESVHLGYG
jgi:hypothetical protein